MIDGKYIATADEEWREVEAIPEDMLLQRTEANWVKSAIKYGTVKLQSSYLPPFGHYRIQ